MPVERKAEGEMLSTNQILRKVAEEAGIAIPPIPSDNAAASPPSGSTGPTLVTKTPSPYRSACPYCFEVFEGKEAADEHMVLERSPERQTPRILRGLLERGVSKEHLDAKLSDFDKRTERTALALLSDGQHRGILATGKPGTGKTRLMVAICREMLLAGKTIEYTHARAFFRRLWATYRDNATENEDAVLKAFCKADLLAIDDLGHEGKVSEAVVGALHEIISARHGDYKATIITTNLGIDEIGRKYDESIASRLQAWLPVVLNGDDWRAT